MTWRRSGLKGTVIVENCDLSTHKEIIREVQREDCHLSVITLDFSGSEQKEHSYEHLFIRIDPSPTETIRAMLIQKYKKLPKQDMERIVEFANGFPKMAELLAQARLQSSPNIGHLDDSIIAKKLLWGRGTPDTNALRALEACSLFTHVGFTGGVKNQCEFVAINIAQMEPSEFFKHMKEFKHRGIAEHRGDFIYVIPKPLAIRLAAKWWKGASPEYISKLFNSTLPSEMKEALCNQIRFLDFVKEARELTIDLCGATGPFGNAEALNTKWGSRLFCALVEVNPEATTESIYKIAISSTTEELLKIGPGRRNLIRSLEKLCFRERTFDKSIQALFLFASAENETLQNNATEQFKSLFKILLPGTQASLDARNNFLKSNIETPDIKKKLLILDAIDSAFTTVNISRYLGAETQGTEPVLSDFEPTKKNVLDYWTSLIDVTSNCTKSDDSQTQIRALQVLENCLKEMIRHGLEKKIISVYSEIASTRYWDGGFKAVCQILNCYSNYQNKEKIERLQNLAEEMKPESFADRIQKALSWPGRLLYDHKDPNMAKQLIMKELDDLARESISQTDHLIHQIKKLSKDTVQNGFYFGQSLGKTIQDKPPIIKKIINAIDQETSDVSILAGLISECQYETKDQIRNMLQSMSKDKTQSKFVVQLTQSLNFDHSEMTMILNGIKSGNINAKNLLQFGFGLKMRRLPTAEVNIFLTDLIDISKNYLPIAFDILVSLCGEDEQKFSEHRELFIRILTDKDLLKHSRHQGAIDEYDWNEYVTKFLKQGEPKIVDYFCENIVDILTRREFGIGITDYLQAILQNLLTNHLEKVWPNIEKVVLNREKYPDYYTSLSWIISYRNDWGNIPFSLDHINSNYILKWCQKYKEILPQFVARGTALYQESSGSINLTQLASGLLSNYPKNTGVLDSFSNTLFSFSYSGSPVAIYESRVKFFNKMLERKENEVNKWAMKMISYFEKELQQEKRIEEEEESGIYRRLGAEL